MIILHRIIFQLELTFQNQGCFGNVRNLQKDILPTTDKAAETAPIRSIESIHKTGDTAVIFIYAQVSAISSAASEIQAYILSILASGCMPIKADGAITTGVRYNRVAPIGKTYPFDNAAKKIIGNKAMGINTPPAINKSPACITVSALKSGNPPAMQNVKVSRLKPIDMRATTVTL